MPTTLRLENKNDYSEVENLTREAFWDLYHPGCSEHLIAHKIRKSPSFIPGLDFVAVQGNPHGGERIVGNIIYTKSQVVDKDQQEHELLTFGPLSVLPSLQKQGSGETLYPRPNF